jgi:hypothetical protein
MRIHDQGSASFALRARRTATLAVGVLLAACSSSNEGTPAGPSETSAATVLASASKSAKDPRVEAWKGVISKTPPPGDGCFHASYPSTTWTEVECDPPPSGHASTAHPPKAKAEPRGSDALSPWGKGSEDIPGQGGSGGDWFLNESAPINQATGTFTSVIGATGSSSYSVQFNTNSFPIVSTNDDWVAIACPSGTCTGWQQVLYSTTVGKTGLYFQYWVLSGGDCQLLDMWDGWTAGSNGGCFLNSGSVPGVPLVSTNDLSGMSVTVAAGSSDVLTMTIEGEAYAGSFASELGLDQGSWNQVEYGVFGDLGFRNVNLSPDTTITTQISAIPYTNTASCTLDGAGGATGETNNLTDPSSAAGGSPSCCLAINSYESGITFTETNAPGQTCTVCGGVGQLCCSTPTNGGCEPGDVCYAGDCEPCGGRGQVCCSGDEPCSVAGDTCQVGLCGLPSTLSASPTTISAAASDGAGLSINRASTEVTASGEWAGSGVTPSFGFSGLPEGVTCAASNDVPPDEGASTITCTTSPSTPLGTFPIVISETISPYPTESTTIELTVTACQPLTCGYLDYTCGSLDDGCGDTLNCGSCPSGETCTAGACYACAVRTCPTGDYFNLETCECQACPCGTLHVDGHYLCAVCK